jgi:hypothetical protein
MIGDVQRLHLAASTQTIADGEVAQCWPLICTAIQTGALGIAELRAVASDLRAGRGLARDGLTIEPAAPDGRLARVALFGDERTCPMAALLEELGRLAAGVDAAPVVDGPVAAPAAAPADARDADLLGVLAGLLGTTPDQLKQDPAVLRAHVERMRVATAAAARDGDLEAALRAIGIDDRGLPPGGSAAEGRRGLIDRERIPEGLRTIADWLEQRTPEAGAAVDRLIARLEAAAAPFLGRLATGEADARRDERLRESARAAIAARLKRPPS